MQHFEVFHRRNRITFVGEHLAHASSWRSSTPRWAELDLYSTEISGVWVFSRIGRSVVYHVPSPSASSCPRRLPYGHQAMDLPGVADLMPCDVCCPSPPVDEPDFWTTHVFETSRPYAVVCDSAAMVDRQLRAGDGSMGWLSVLLAREAASADPGLSVIDPGLEPGVRVRQEV